jgi:sigma-E factor negative regulatory protein RseC
MLTETGRVVAVEADGVWVETIRSSTCGTCSLQKGCGHGLLNRIGDGRSHYTRVLYGACSATDCTVGDQVRIAVPEGVILRGSTIVYLLPLLCMLLGAALAGGLLQGNPDLLAVLGAMLGFAAGLALVRRHARRHRNDRRLQPILLEVQPHAGRGGGGGLASGYSPALRR